MEILSPAGSPEGLIASIKGGCDAVYLGGKTFGARAFSDNFNDKELEGAIAFAHDNNVKAYITVNTLIKDHEMSDAVNYVRFLADIGADAILIQDVGLLGSIQKVEISKHASTQMGVHSVEGLEWCAEHGLDRAVLSRELTLEEIEKIVPNSPIETEVFIQGALCYCFSGGCLLSSVCGGRSGNRGQCAQPCRKKYTMGNREGFIFSNADIYGIEYLQKLSDLGVSAGKIEGRMRSHAYAYLSSKVYSMANKGADPKEYVKENDLLKTVFNRGFCDGYLGGVNSCVQNRYADNRGFYLGEVEVKNRTMDLRFLFDGVSVKDGISLFKDENKIGGFKLSSTGIVQIPFKLENGTYDLYRTYDPRIDEIKNLIGPAPKLTGTGKRPTKKVDIHPIERKRLQKSELSVYMNSLKTMDIVLERADRVYFDANPLAAEAKAMCEKKDVEFVLNLPRFQPFPFRSELDCNVMVNTPGQLKTNSDVDMYGSYHMNMFNSYMHDECYQQTLSVELSKREIAQICKHYEGRVEVMGFGRVELMCTRDPAMGNGIATDEKEFCFPVWKDVNGLSHMINSSDLLLLPHLGELANMGVESIGIDLRKRPAQLAKLVMEAYATNDVSKKDAIVEVCGNINYGAYQRGIN